MTAGSCSGAMSKQWRVTASRNRVEPSQVEVEVGVGESGVEEKSEGQERQG